MVVRLRKSRPGLPKIQAWSVVLEQGWSSQAEQREMSLSQRPKASRMKQTTQRNVWKGSRWKGHAKQQRCGGNAATETIGRANCSEARRLVASAHRKIVIRRTRRKFTEVDCSQASKQAPGNQRLLGISALTKWVVGAKVDITDVVSLLPRKSSRGSSQPVGSSDELMYIGGYLLRAFTL